MNGTETRDELDRCRLWDFLYLDGPLSVAQLAQRSKIRSDRARRLAMHEWFAWDNGILSVSRKSLLTTSRKTEQ